MKVPVFDLKRAHSRIAGPLAERWQRVLDNTSFVLGPEVKEFEDAFAKFLGAARCVGVANGTDALTVALRALDLKPGDEVLVPAFSFFATAEAVVWAGGRPVFVDVEASTLNFDAADAEHRITPRTVGVIGVHLYGRPFDAAALSALCARHGLWLIEDAAQAHGAVWKECRVGTLGQLAAWSFYPSKNLGCFGDGGGVTGTDAALLEKVYRIANHGQVARYEHAAIGTNSRLDSLQAAVLNCRLPLLDSDNRRRRELACKYQGELAAVGDLRFPADAPGSIAVYHQMTVRTARREALMKHLAAKGIGCAVHYPSPLHHQAAWKGVLDVIPVLPVAEEAAREVLCLPMFPEMTDEELAATCDAIREFFAG